MATIKELEENLNKMQVLLAAAQNAVQKKTFQDIISNLTKRLEEAKAKEQKPELETKTDIVKRSEIVEKVEDTKAEEVEAVATPAPDQNEPETDESLPPQQDYAFRGIGILYGKIVKRYEDNDSYYNLISEGKTYELIYNSPRVREFLKADYNPDKDRYVTVYPHLTHFPQPKGKVKPPKLAFTIVAANDTPHEELGVSEFKLFGLWQFIAVCKCPVISIHRNRKGKGDRVARIKEKFDNEKLHKKITKANHVPLLWKDAPVKPFRFNPKLDKDQQGDRYFVEIKAKFLQSREQWGFMELLAEPTLDIPKFYKPIKVKTA